MAFQGEYFVDRYGAQAAERTPPLRRMLEMGVPVGAGTDATRVASYNPFVSLYWMSTGKTLGGLALYTEKNRLSREEALRLYTQGSTWMSREEGKRGTLAVGQLADLAVLTADYFSIPDEEIKSLESVLTILGGKPVYAVGDFKHLDPGDLPVMPDWSPVQKYRGYWTPDSTAHLQTTFAFLLRSFPSAYPLAASFAECPELAAGTPWIARRRLRVLCILIVMRALRFQQAGSLDNLKVEDVPKPSPGLRRRSYPGKSRRDQSQRREKRRGQDA